MILDVLRITLPGFAIGAVVMALANRHAAPATSRGRWLKLGVFFLIVHAVLVAAAAGRTWITVLLAGVLAAGAGELWRAWRQMSAPRPRWLWPAYVVLAALATAIAWRLPPQAFALLFVVVASCDGFSQVVGQWLGRRPLAPRISPGKTRAGFAGGVVAAVVVAVLLRGMLPVDLPAATALGAATAVAGLGGDLAASWVKRRAGIKDFSSALPGQGGFLDRFDSLLGALLFVGGGLLAAS